MVGCWCEESLVAKIDRARGKLSRSQFCREALADALRKLGISVPEMEAMAPDRTGKGGPKQKGGPATGKPKPRILDRRGFPLSSKLTSAAQAGLAAGAEMVIGQPEGSSPSREAGEPIAGKRSPKRSIDARPKSRPKAGVPAPK
jgi:hypothetical protein